MCSDVGDRVLGQLSPGGFSSPASNGKSDFFYLFLRALGSLDSHLRGNDIRMI